MSHNAASSPAVLHAACLLAVWFVHRLLIEVWPGGGRGGGWVKEQKPHLFAPLRLCSTGEEIVGTRADTRLHARGGQSSRVPTHPVPLP